MSIYVWQIDLSVTDQEQEFLGLLSRDELERAQRFKFAIHRQRYIMARGSLRQILSSYIDIPAHDIVFKYGQHGKPFLAEGFHQFNISHSDNKALIAITKDRAIGVDIEKIKPESKEDIAKRFFSEKEYAALQQLSEADRIPGFYTIWTKKEALIKALGEGLFTPLNEFTVSPKCEPEAISLSFQGKSIVYHVQSISVHPEYQAAVATSGELLKIEMMQKA
jgi:4'-phosphopantetheinyl transferase